MKYQRFITFFVFNFLFLAAKKSEGQGFLGFPLEKKANISCDFCCYLFIDGSCHGGIDYSVGNSTIVLAAADGKVIEVVNKFPNYPDFSGGYGNYVKIKHDNGYITIYGHLLLNSIKVKIGQYVKGGEVIALSDNSGYSTGPHLHFEVRSPSGQKVNPYGSPPDYINGCGPNHLWFTCPPQPFKKIFSCQAVAQNPNYLFKMLPGQIAIFELDFKNTGNIIWVRNQDNPNYIELWSADKVGVNVPSFLAHPSWISPKIVMTLPNGEIDPNIVQKQVLPGQVARFIFYVKVPNEVPSEKTNVDLLIYFIPALAGKTDKDNCWNGAHFLIKIITECKSGQKEEVECGKCGKKYRECINGKWGDWSICQGEGECFKGESKIINCGVCATQNFVCNDKCFWQALSGCNFNGQCQPGSSQTQECGSNIGECKKGTKTIYCTSECLWPSWDSVPCVGEISPSSEICDFKDNDCDSKTDEDCFKPVYRFYYSKGNDKDHFLKNDTSPPSEYVIENNGNPVFYTYKTQVSGTNPLFRLYNGTIKDHMYTDSEEEKEAAIAKGYKLEGNIGYCAASQKNGTVPLYRCWSSKYSDHLSTTNKNECNAEGYVYEQITCYVWLSSL